MAQGQATFELSAKPTKSLLGTSLQLQGLLYTLIFTLTYNCDAGLQFIPNRACRITQIS